MLNDPVAVGAAAEALGQGVAVAHGFGNFYALTARPEPDVVAAVNRLKGRPAGQVGSVTAVPERIVEVFDLARLPAEIPEARIRSLMEELFALGPFGLRGPAADHMPAHLTAVQDGARTVQVIAPGHRCPSNVFLAAAHRSAGSPYLFITSINRSRHTTGSDAEPAHWQAVGIRADFAGPIADGRLYVLEHGDEAAALAVHPEHTPMSTTVLSFHHVPGSDTVGRPLLTLERHGSLSAVRTGRIAARHGFAVTIGPGARDRLTVRNYQL
ncbi:hypothetical protein [Streptomyces sp. NPDC000410]|uniref:hypothetical protein n=1 Tax=Streptomyces sp. NPDC000410 TaxID=3154254 RepID=UPI003320A48E